MAYETKTEHIQMAFHIVGRLQRWIEDRDGLSVVPVVSLDVSLDHLQIYVADHPVWNCEDDLLEDLTFNYCRDEWLQYINELRPFAADAKRLRIAQEKALAEDFKRA